MNSSHGVVHVGNPHGRVAIWCNESEAWDIASHFPYPDKFGLELAEAIVKAYPKDDEADA